MSLTKYLQPRLVQLLLVSALVTAPLQVAHATFLSVITNQTVNLPASGIPEMDVTLLVVGDTAGTATFTLATTSLQSSMELVGGQYAVDFTLRVQAYDDGGSPPPIDFGSLSWELLDASNQFNNVTDNYFFESAGPVESTAFFTSPAALSGTPTVEGGHWTSGLLPSTNPASEAVFTSRIFLDTADNFDTGGGLKLNMAVSLDGAHSDVSTPGTLTLFAGLLVGMIYRKRQHTTLFPT